MYSHESMGNLGDIWAHDKKRRGINGWQGNREAIRGCSEESRAEGQTSQARGWVSRAHNPRHVGNPVEGSENQIAHSASPPVHADLSPLFQTQQKES